MLRKMFLGSYHPSQSVKDAAKMAALYLYAGAMAYRTYKEARSLWADLMADRAEKKTFEDFTRTHPWNPRVPAPRTTPDGTVAGVHLDDLKYKVWKDPDHGLMIDPVGPEDLKVEDYWEISPAFGPMAKPNPHPEGTDEYIQWERNQDATSF